MELLDRTIFKKCSKHIAIRHHHSGRAISEVSYEQLWNEMEKVAMVLREQHIEGKIIGVQLLHCPALIAVIGGIIISGNSFYCIGSHALDQLLSEYGECASYLLEELEPTGECDDLQILLGLSVFAKHLILAVSVSRTVCYPGLAFCVRTSGSTGRPKTVLVPSACIMPNVLSLTDRLELCERDVIFVCSPPTFDPFVVDILMGLRAGATLLLVDNSIRLSAKRLLSRLFPGVTVMQLTPSMFARWDKIDVWQVIFGPATTLRILVLGGEKFPTFKRPAESRVRVYNIYGITEVSCWSMIQQVCLENEEEIPLGKPLDHSITLQLRNLDDERLLAETNTNGSKIGQLYIGSSSRKCAILGNADESYDTLSGEGVVFRPTGDVVELTQDGKYYYRGRSNRMIKRFGWRVSLSEVESVVQSHPSVLQCALCFFSERNSLVMFVKADSNDCAVEETLWPEMRAKLRPSNLPDELHRIDKFPLSAHGKVCADGLRQIYERLKRQTCADGSISAVDFFRKELCTMGIAHGCGLAKDGVSKKLKLNTSFIDLGGTSFAALRLHTALQDKFKAQLPELITLLIDPSIPLDEAFKYVERNVATKGMRPVEAEASKHETSNSDLLTIVCHYNLKKCIDSRASIMFCEKFGHILTIGSHSGIVLTISVATNAVVSRILLPDRVECAVSFLTLENNVVRGVVGCYDGFLYCFDPLDGSQPWKYDAGAMIKCTPLVLPQTNLIIFGCYSPDANLHCIEGGQSSPTLRWKVQIGSKPILSQPVALGGENEGLILVATLDGTLAAVSAASGYCVWRRALSSRNIPIFSTPTFLSEYSRIACCGVDGTFGIYDALGGTEISNHKLPGNVFSSIETLKHTNDRIHFIVGCYDRNLHCIEYLPVGGETLLPKWRIEVQSQIYAAPRSVKDHLIVCTTSGWVNLIDPNKIGDEAQTERNIIAAMKMKGELFATPVVHGDLVFVGCRDNFLYGIRVKV
ncbi:beta-alanine-activating enzyme-like [Anopheles stephensi]|uniref:beta-alanine-activating enzyme-like n=1 Tax=Anopheles stephensi TaxID=30069 RepID=UPI0016588219|nr:beta-alanine-activating enzyme-like [Anopheles stephensi]